MEQEPHSVDCACDRCRTRRRKQYRREHDAGIRRMVDVAPSREHLEWLAGHGVGRRTIARHLGCAQLTLLRITNGVRKQVHRDTEKAILGFTLETAASVANCATVDATATRLRYQGLIALGYTQAFISHSTGRTVVNFDLRERINRRRALAVLDLCRQIGDTPGPSRKAAVQARHKGWRVPADFDEDQFYSPDWDGIEDGPVASECRALDYVAEYDFLAAAGGRLEDIAVRLNITASYLQMLLSKRERGVGPFDNGDLVAAS